MSGDTIEKASRFSRIIKNAVDQLERELASPSSTTSRPAASRAVSSNSNNDQEGTSNQNQTVLRSRAQQDFRYNNI